MLSAELKNLRTMMNDSASGGLYLSPENVTSVSNILKTLIDDARELENSQIPASLKLRTTDLKNNNIVRFPGSRPNQQNPKGGGVA